MTHDFVPVPSERLLSIDPAPFGFGFVVLEYEPLRLVAWGTRACRRENGTALAAVRQCVLDYQPTAIVLPDWREPSHPLRGAPLEAFIAAIEEVLADPDVEVLISSPRDVQERFSRVGAKTKQGVADYLADEFPELHAILPMPRQNSDRERQAMSVFDALAFALAVQADRLDAEDHARS